MANINIYSNPAELYTNSSSELTGYPATNMKTPSVAQSLRTATNTAQSTVTLAISGEGTNAVPVGAILLNGLNFTQSSMSGAGQTIDDATVIEPNGRAKAVYEYNGTDTNNSAILTISAQSTIDGNPYHEIGAAWWFQDTHEVLCPEYGYQVSHGYPRRDYALPNGRMAYWDVGTRASAAVITLTWLALTGEDPGALWQLAQEPVLLVIDPERGHVWPVIAAPGNCSVKATNSVFTAMQGQFLELA